jgi:molybdenum cofactor cytidylyltransferase
MSANPHISAVLLAAGASTRFGGGKLVHPLRDGVAVAAHAARNLIAAGLDVTAVVRSGDVATGEMLERENCKVAYCREAVHGMGHTLAHGIASSAEAGGWIVALGDMPRISPATIKAVVAAVSAGATIAAPFYRGERGLPVGFGAVMRDELLQLHGDTGARAVLERHRAEIVRIECDDAGVLLDVDTREDLRGLD